MPRGWGRVATKERGWVGSERYSERGLVLYIYN